MPSVKTSTALVPIRDEGAIISLPANNEFSHKRMNSPVDSSLQFLAHALSVYPTSKPDPKELALIALPLLTPHLPLINESMVLVPVSKAVDLAPVKSAWSLAISLEPITSRLLGVINKISGMFSKCRRVEEPTDLIIPSKTDAKKSDGPLATTSGNSNTTNHELVLFPTSEETEIQDNDQVFDVTHQDNSTELDDNSPTPAPSCSNDIVSVKTNHKQTAQSQHEIPLLLYGSEKSFSDFLTLISPESRDAIKALLSKTLLDLTVDQKETLIHALTALIKGQHVDTIIHFLKALVLIPAEQRVLSIDAVFSVFQDLDLSLCQKMLAAFTAIDNEERVELIQMLHPILKQKIDGNTRLGLLNDFKDMSKSVRKLVMGNYSSLPTSQQSTFLKDVRALFHMGANLPPQRKKVVLELLIPLLKKHPFAQVSSVLKLLPLILGNQDSPDGLVEGEDETIHQFVDFYLLWLTTDAQRESVIKEMESIPKQQRMSILTLVIDILKMAPDDFLAVFKKTFANSENISSLKKILAPFQYANAAKLNMEKNNLHDEIENSITRHPMDCLLFLVSLLSKHKKTDLPKDLVAHTTFSDMVMKILEAPRSKDVFPAALAICELLAAIGERYHNSLFIHIDRLLKYKSPLIALHFIFALNLYPLEKRALFLDAVSGIFKTIRSEKESEEMLDVLISYDLAARMGFIACEVNIVDEEIEPHPSNPIKPHPSNPSNRAPNRYSRPSSGLPPGYEQPRLLAGRQQQRRLLIE